MFRWIYLAHMGMEFFAALDISTQWAVKRLSGDLIATCFATCC